MRSTLGLRVQIRCSFTHVQGDFIVVSGVLGVVECVFQGTSEGFLGVFQGHFKDFSRVFLEGLKENIGGFSAGCFK